MSEIRKVLVVGAGTMGHGIAQVSAQAGCGAVLADLDGERLSSAISKVAGSLAKRVEKGKLAPDEREAVLGRLSTTTDAVAAAAEADLVVEAVPEDLDLKRKLFADLSAAAPAETILATNTSSLPVSKIATASDRPDRVIGAHFFNPVPVMPLLELVRGSATSDETVERVREFGAALGKEMIVVRDSPGFATSRLGVVIGLEAIRMLEQGVASAEDIDRAMELGYRHPMGPLRLTDLVGLDVRLSIAEHLHRELGGDQYRPPELLRKLVSEGKLGRKTGEGFHAW
jgi:3-hydroxybutyryl-CoA dehydrogenase